MCAQSGNLFVCICAFMGMCVHVWCGRGYGRYDQHCDVWSLGMVFYELLTSKVPYNTIGEEVTIILWIGMVSCAFCDFIAPVCYARCPELCA